MSRIGARKQDIIIAMCTSPDVCLTPRGPKMVPVPYQITCTLGRSTDVTPTVRFNRAPVYVYAHSVAQNVKGDEPGTGGGVVSGVNVGKVWAFTSSQNVFSEGRKVVREGDRCWMNCKV
jgi:hypothetical protein